MGRTVGETMPLMYRPTRAADLNACLALIPEGLLFDDAMRPGLLRLWREVLARGCAESAVIYDEKRPPGSQIVGFGLSVFVTEEFAHEAKTQLPPYIDKHVLDRWARGCSPHLDLDAIREANSGAGLHLLIMHHGVMEDSLSGCLPTCVNTWRNCGRLSLTARSPRCA